MISGGILQSELLYPGLPVAMLKGQRMMSQDLVLLVVVQSKLYIYNIYIYFKESRTVVNRQKMLQEQFVEE